MTPARFLSVYLAVALLALTAGCGDSGSQPVLYPEVRFEVRPAATGEATFRVTGLAAAGTGYDFPAGTSFKTTGRFNFYFEGAAPPYSGIFRQEGDAAITVTVFRERVQVSPVFITSGPGTSVAINVPAGTTGPPPVPVPARPLVRVDVCAPLPELGTCSTTLPEDGGLSGVPYSGTLGDLLNTHILVDDGTRLTPAIYFLQNARDTVNAVFRSTSRQLLEARLYVDDDLKQRDSNDDDDVLLREDI